MSMNQPELNAVTKVPLKQMLRVNLRTYSMIIALFAIWILFTATTNGIFLTPRNLSNLFEQSAETAILAVGAVLVIVAAQIDLSVGSLAGLTGGVATICQVWLKMNAVESIVIALVLGVLLGLFQGWWVAYQNVPAFIVTLGGMLVFRGIVIGLTNGQSISPLRDGYVAIGESYVPPMVGIVLAVLAILGYAYFLIRRRQTRRNFGFAVRPIASDVVLFIVIAVVIGVFVYVMNAYQGIPIPIFIVLLLALLFSFIAAKTRFGRSIYAIGGNLEAARMSGIPIRGRILSVFALSGLMAAICGIVLTARLDAGTVDAGTNFELNAIAACVIGGTSLMGGVGSVTGAVIGAMVMGSIDDGMSLMNAAPFWQYVVKGLILIVAVWIDIQSKRRQAA
ncbi:xylose ABC transporter permease [Alicyclobacillus contaminans]|uniref:sugar ABC transporter permease n=1 Tax=Alicyclobacillus contaminans TaxID=392016 RepID=UPI00040EEE4E|nr:sugar ABC transporter permease [Alicyclobacillus contaminans]GMA51380.1 xylose ABC transporter permease [Alicyclobacillus contaminans]